MNLEKAIVFILVFLTSATVFFDVQLYYEMYEFLRQPNSIVGNLYSNTLLAVGATAHITTFVGICKLIKRKKVELIDAFKFPLFYQVIVHIYWYLLIFLSKGNSSVFTFSGTSWLGYVMIIFNSMLIILAAIHFSTKIDKTEINTAIPAVPTARCINWIIDMGLISFFTISYFKSFQREFILQNFFSNKESLFVFYILNRFLYYFILELVFLQTIGKLHNNSFVEYKGNRFTTILLRTVSRFIPLEVLTGFGNRAWHDLISKTRVIVFKKESDASRV